MQSNFDYGSLGINESNKQEYIEMLGYDFEYFVPTEYISSDKVSIEIKYNLSNLISYEQLKEQTEVYKLQAIKSLIELVINSNKLLAINLEEDNLYFTTNTRATQLAKVLDVSRLNEEEYVNQIKGLLGNLFMKESSSAIISSN